MALNALPKIASWLAGSPAKRRAQEQYIALVERSRNPFFYTDCGVPDTLDGRFEIIVLHLFLHLRDTSPDGPSRQLLLEAFFDDMDRSLREMGVGDMGVSKRVKPMAEAAFGRFKAYETAGRSLPDMTEALRKNIYADRIDESGLERLAKYVCRP